jgi:DNA replication protein
MDFFRDGNVSISRYLLRNYKRLGLDEKKIMVLIHIISEHERGNKIFDIPMLVEYTTVNNRELFDIVDFLKDKGFISSNMVQEEDGSYCEYVSLETLVLKLLADEKATQKSNHELTGLLNKFVQAFSRPVTPVEYQTVLKWVEEGYTEEQITFALKQALYADVRNVRYVDKVLMGIDNANER